MEQHPVPQNVTTFQFRLVGDMTLKQFGYLAGGALLAYACYKLPLPIFFSVPLAILVAILGFGLAFVPVEERPMDVWIMSFIKSIYSPTLYLWQREKHVSEPASQVTNVPVPPTQSPAAKPTPPATTVAPHTTTVTLPVIPQAPKVQPVVVPTETNRPQMPVTPHITEPAPSSKPQQAPITPTTPTHHEIKTPIPVPTPTLNTPTPNVMQKTVQTAPKQEGHAKRISFLSRIFSLLFPKKPSHIQDVIPSVQEKKTITTLPTPTVIHHTQTQNGGNLMDSLKNSFGVHSHPAQSAPAASQQSSKDLFANLKTPSVAGTNLSVPGLNTPASKQPVQEKQDDSKPTQAQSDAISSKNAELEQKLSTLQKELTTKDMSAERIIELQKQLTEVLSERQKMEAELQTLRTKLTQLQSQAQTPTQTAQPKIYEAPRGPTVKVITAETAVKSGMPMLTTFPNVVTGIIKDVEGILLPGVLVTVRDKEGVPLRALKTNRLGQFAASTPLPNGTYIIEVEDPRSKFVFDRVQITLNGNVAPAVEMIAKSQKQLDREKLEKAIFGGPT